MLTVLGIILIVIGAVLTFAVDAALDDVDLVAVGWIVMGGGAIALVAAAIQGAAWSNLGGSKMRHERHVSDDGRHVVDETRVD